MAQQKAAQLITACNIGANARLLEFALEDELGFTGGQYIIVNTGVPLAEGKVAKRAYSILSSDAQQRRFQIAVRRIGSGPGSNYMFDLPLHAELAFSGPWGKYLPRNAQSVNAGDRATTVLATDTGITAAMGLIGAEMFTPFREDTTVLWLVESDEYFLPEAFIRERLANLCRHLGIVRVPADHIQRESWLRLHKDALYERILQEYPATVFLSGDGRLLSELRDVLQNGPSPLEVIVESFFHHQELKSVKIAVP
jgi:ferredoxin-NADP reductase